MISYKKIAYIGTGLATIGTGAILIATPVGATANPANLSLAGQLAQTFHLNQSSVQNTIHQYYKTHPNDKRMTYKKRLAMAVKNGRITATQEQSILAEHQYLLQSLKGLKSESPTQKKVTIKAVHSTAKAWAKANNIPVGLLYLRHR